MPRPHTPVVGSVGSGQRYPPHHGNITSRAAGPGRVSSRRYVFTDCPLPCQSPCHLPCPLEETGVLDTPSMRNVRSVPVDRSTWIV
jgi:hypothetical protein